MAGRSHREYLTWQQFLEDEWNHPNRSDHYLMQIAGAVTAYITRDDSWLNDIQKSRLRFEDETKKKEESPEFKRKKSSFYGKLKWIASFGGNLIRKKRGN